MIVKCQRSLESTEEHPTMLFYNRDRSWFAQFDLTAPWNALFGPTTSPEDNRFFADVIWPTLAEPPVFRRRLPEQIW